MPRPSGGSCRSSCGSNSKIRSFVPRQIDDTEAINRLGNRLDAYASISLPVLLLTGARTPGHLRERTDRLAAVLPAARPVAVMPKQGHGASDRAPREVAAAHPGLRALALGLGPGLGRPRPHRYAARSSIMPVPMPSIHTSLLTAIPCGEGQTLPG